MKFLLLLALGCGTVAQVEPKDIAPEPIDLAECAVCGMVVGEQPSPRGQLAYRDGTHAHICSIEEVRALAAAPGPRGTPVGVWVEDLPADFDWRNTSTEPLEWIDANAAWFVFGAERSLVMGVPVLTYGDSDEAYRVADALGTHPASWSDLLRTPVLEIPKTTLRENP